MKPGDRVAITLGFADGQRIGVEFEVRKADASGPGGMKGMDMDGMEHQH